MLPTGWLMPGGRSTNRGVNGKLAQEPEPIAALGVPVLGAVPLNNER